MLRQRGTGIRRRSARDHSNLAGGGARTPPRSLVLLILNTASSDCLLPAYAMISLEQWRAAVGGWNSRNLRAIYRRYGSRRMVRARDWARFQLAMELYSVDVYCSLYWLIVGLFAFFSSDGWRSATFGDICDFPLAIRRALIAAPTILVRHASRDNLPQLCVLASPTAAPELRSSIVYLQRLWKLESPSVSSILRLLRASSGVATDRRRRRGAQSGTCNDR